MTVPPPPSPLSCNVMTLEAGRVIHRVHQSGFGATEFNPGYGASRFAPLTTGDNKTVPTCYAGTSFGCAVYESVFHDIDVTARFKSVSMRQVEELVYSEIELRRDLRVARLFEPDLNKWGYSRGQVVDTPPSTYPQTRLWSAAIHDSDGAIDGMIWTSRKFDEERALVLFGGRVKASDLSAKSSERIAMSPRWLGKLREFGSLAGGVLTI